MSRFASRVPTVLPIEETMGLRGVLRKAGLNGTSCSRLAAMGRTALGAATSAAHTGLMSDRDLDRGATGAQPERPNRAVALLRSVWLLAMTGGGLALGVIASWAGRPDLGIWCWTIPAAIVGLRLVWTILRDLLRRQGGVDVIAVLAIGGALATGESFAAALIALMLATGESLETYADGQARRELSALLGRAPQTVRRYVHAALETVPIAAIVPGNCLLVGAGEVVPVDGFVRGSAAVLDESALTGESRQVVREEGDPVSSGVLNAGGAFDLEATATADTSTYAGIVRLVEAAGKAKAPFVRLADRYALLFVPLALGVAGFAWLLSGDPTRALAVLVVATPCPLLLAAPIAIVAGISRAARRGIIVKGGGPLETLARSRVLLFDKTGTLTAGRPRLAAIETEAGVDAESVLRLSAALEQVSPHVLAGAVVQAAHVRALVLPLPTDVRELSGAGIAGCIEGRAVLVGTSSFASQGRPVPGWARAVGRRARIEGATIAFVSIDERLTGALLLDDPIRAEAPRAIRALRRAGFTRQVMITGDHHSVAELVGAAIGLDAVLAERSPSDKVAAVGIERGNAEGPVVMVGDGINDAPALAAADVGVAMGARGATASSEAADIVITVDRLDRLAEAVGIARRSRQIALQSVIAGMSLSLAAMLAAAVGLLPVVAGAILQEGIDVAVILNALRALGGGVARPVEVAGWAAQRAKLLAEHRILGPRIARIRSMADRLDSATAGELQPELEAMRRFLSEELVEHEVGEDRIVYPMLAAAMASDDATSALHGTHSEIFHLVGRYVGLLDEIGPDGLAEEDRPDLRRLLYGLDAILRLHMAQEEELYLSISDPSAVTAAA